MLYKQIKKNEHSPNTDYLFSNINKQNTIEKSLRQMELINSVDFQSDQHNKYSFCVLCIHNNMYIIIYACYWSRNLWLCS